MYLKKYIISITVFAASFQIGYFYYNGNYIASYLLTAVLLGFIGLILCMHEICTEITNNVTEVETNIENENKKTNKLSEDLQNDVNECYKSVGGLLGKIKSI